MTYKKISHIEAEAAKDAYATFCSSTREPVIPGVTECKRKLARIKEEEEKAMEQEHLFVKTENIYCSAQLSKIQEIYTAAPFAIVASSLQDLISLITTGKGKASRLKYKACTVSMLYTESGEAGEFVYIPDDIPSFMSKPTFEEAWALYNPIGKLPKDIAEDFVSWATAQNQSVIDKASDEAREAKEKVNLIAQEIECFNKDVSIDNVSFAGCLDYLNAINGILYPLHSALPLVNLTED